MYPSGFEGGWGWVKCYGGGLVQVLLEACWGVVYIGLKCVGGLSSGFCFSAWRGVGGLHVVGLPVRSGCCVVWCGVPVSYWFGVGWEQLGMVY